MGRFGMLELITGIGLILFFEGVVYALFPSKIQQLMKNLVEGDAANIRLVGIAAFISGFLILFWTRS